jgi:hypothetical protein
MMLSQDLINFLGGMVGAMFAWLIKVIWGAITELQKDLHELERDMHQDFVRRDDYKSDMDEIRAMFRHIIEKLDGKADK